jgi:pimeloyl-ACP methyl ester carboxylesterase
MNTKPIYRTPVGEKIVMDLYDSLLARWPVPYETLTIPTRYGDTYVIACGDETKPPLVLLHGAASNSAVWAGDVADYVRHYRVYAIDLPGEAGKSSPNRPPWNSPAYAEWLADVFAALEINKAALLGISQGGWTALKFAESGPGPARIEKLVLVCPGGVVPDRLGFIIRAITLSLLGGWGARRMARMLFGSQPVPEGVEDILTLVMTHFKARVGKPYLFSDEELRCLTMPVFLLGGTQDVIRDLDKIAARLRPLVPDLAVTIVPGAGHVVLDSTRYTLPFLTSGNLT